MSFTVTCPICGKRELYEFRFGNEDKGPPPDLEGLTPDVYSEWIHSHKNISGIQKEWWYHKDGCGTWFTVSRDTSTNRELSQAEENA